MQTGSRAYSVPFGAVLCHPVPTGAAGACGPTIIVWHRMPPDLGPLWAVPSDLLSGARVIRCCHRFVWQRLGVLVSSSRGCRSGGIRWRWAQQACVAVQRALLVALRAPLGARLAPVVRYHEEHDSRIRISTAGRGNPGAVARLERRSRGLLLEVMKKR